MTFTEFYMDFLRDNHCDCCSSSNLKVFSSIRTALPPQFIHSESNFNRKNFSSFVKCEFCGHVRRACRYDNEILTLLYGGAKATSYSQLTHYTPRARLVESDLRKCFSDPRALSVTAIRDYGGDKGQISRQIFTDTVSSVEVIEYDDSSSAIYTRACNYSTDASVTLHLALHVLEHLDDPRDFVANIMQSFSGLDILFLEVPYEMPNTFFSPGHYEHIQFYTEKSLSELLSGFGLRFSIINCIGYGRSLPCLQLVAVKEGSRFSLQSTSRFALDLYCRLVRNPLGFKCIWFLLGFLKRTRLSCHVRQYA